MSHRQSDSSLYSGVPCDKCGGDTYLMPSGSIWCSAEDPHPGGHFVKRVAFERPPAREPRTTPMSTMPPARRALPALERRASQPTSQPVRAKAVDPYATGMDAFIEKDGER